MSVREEWRKVALNPSGNYQLAPKKLSNSEMTICATFKISNVKECYDFGDLENKMKIEFMICNTKFCHHARE